MSQMIPKIVMTIILAIFAGWGVYTVWTYHYDCYCEKCYGGEMIFLQDAMDLISDTGGTIWLKSSKRVYSEGTLVPVEWIINRPNLRHKISKGE